MMKKQWFHLNLFREGMRQLSLSGWMFLAIFSLEAILIPFSMNQSANRTYATVVSPIAAHWILLTAFCVVAPILTVTMFRFLNSRNASDFYHSLPYTRPSIFLSFFLSVVAWLGIIIAGSALVSTVMHLAFARTLSLSFSGLWMLAFKCFLSAMLVTAVIALAMSVTGTLFNNLIIAALILFFPRLFLTAIPVSVNSILPMCTDDLPFFLSPFCNIILQTLASSLSLESVDWNMVSDTDAILYSAVLTLVYIALGCFLFTRRKSEASAAAAPSRFMQAVFRIALTTAYTMIVTAVLYADGLSEDAFFYFILYVIGVVIYCVYELITTHKFSKLLRSLPGLGIVLALNIVLLAGMNLFSMAQLSYNPKATQISAVSVCQSGYSYTSSVVGYAQRKSKQAEITDEQIITVVSEQLQKANAVYKERHSESDYDKAFRECVHMTLRIKSNGVWHTRCVPLTNEQDELLGSALGKNQMIREVWMNLPQPIDNTMYISELSLDYQDGNELRKLFDTLQAEVNEIGFEAWYNYCNLNGTYPENLSNLYYTYNDNDRTYDMSIPLNPQVLPKTCAKLLTIAQLDEEMQALTKSLTEIRRQLADEESKELNYYSIWFNLTLKEGDEYVTYYFDSGESEEACLELLTYITSYQENYPDAERLQYVKGMVEYEMSNGDWYSCSFILPINRTFSMDFAGDDLMELFQKAQKGRDYIVY